MENTWFIARRNLLLALLFKFIPIKKDRFYFCSFHGLYADSPRRLSEALHDVFPNAEFCWEIAAKSKEEKPSYIKPLEPNSIKSVFFKSTSSVLIDNYAGVYSAYGKEKSFKLFVVSLLKKKKQYNISTWHGVPLKKIALDEPKYHGKDIGFYSSSNILLSNGLFTDKIFHHITKNRISTLMCGWPRNDVLFKINEKVNECYRKKMGIPCGKKILLYAPTFRDNDLEMSGLWQIRHLDISKLLPLMSKKFGGEWVVVFRVHDSVIQNIPQNNTDENVIWGNKVDDMGEYLAVADVLMTDYSSCFFDFALSKRPCFLFCPDYKNYSEKERGLYFDIKELPFPVSFNIEELYEKIQLFDERDYLTKLEIFQKKIGCKESGNSTRLVMKKILSFLKEKNYEIS